MNIVQMLGTNCTSYYANRPHVWLAFHYTAGKTSKKGAARNTAAWFANPQNRNGSADFIVDDAECVQYNADLNNRRCWAVGDDSRRYSKGGQLYGKAINCNTISIEICSSTRSGAIPQANSADWYFTDAALNNALELGAYLMKKYNIDIDHVVRHYDISGKYCPGIIGWNTNSGSDGAWLQFKARLKKLVAPESEEIDMTEKEMIALIDKRIADKLNGADSKPSEWAETELAEAVTLGITDGQRPQGYATRQEAAIMVLRAVKKGVGESVKQAVTAVIKRVKGAL